MKNKKILLYILFIFLIFVKIKNYSYASPLSYSSWGTDLSATTSAGTVVNLTAYRQAKLVAGAVNSGITFSSWAGIYSFIYSICENKTAPGVIDWVMDGNEDTTDITIPSSVQNLFNTYAHNYYSPNATVRNVSFTYQNQSYIFPVTLVAENFSPYSADTWTNVEMHIPFISSLNQDVGVAYTHYAGYAYTTNVNDYNRLTRNALELNSTSNSDYDTWRVWRATSNYQNFNCVKDYQPHVIWIIKKVSGHYIFDCVASLFLYNESSPRYVMIPCQYKAIDQLPVAVQSAFADAFDFDFSTSSTVDITEDVTVSSDYVATDNKPIVVHVDFTPDDYVNFKETIQEGVSSAIDFTIPQNFAIDFSPLLVAGQTLSTKFPFSLPWDIYNILSLFNSPAVAPSFTIDFPASIFGSAGSITLDFSYFSTLATMVRYCITIIFTIWLIIVTKNLI